MKIIFQLFILFQISLFGYEYDSLLLKAQANIFPKLILLDKDLSKKLSDKQISLCIVYHPSDRLKAMDIQYMIRDKFKGKLEDYRFITTIKEFSEVKKDDKFTAYYMLNATDIQIKTVCDLAQKRRVPTFVYDAIYMRDGALISMKMQDSMTIYLNKKIRKNYDIDFVDMFYQIVRFTDD